MSASPAPTEASAGARVLPVLLGVLAVTLAILPIETPDVWYHLAAGRLMLETGTWPRVNTFSFTAPEHPWIDLHWGFQLLLYGAYRIGGVNGCIGLVAVLVLATTGVVYAVARRFVSPAAAAMLVVVALVVASPRFVPRPELVSFLLLAVYGALLDAYPRSGRAIYVLVPLQIVWTNAQGISVLGLVLIGCYWAGATAALLPLPAGWRAASGCDRPAWRRLTLVLALAAVACLVNPYGLEGARFPLQLFTTVSGQALVSERIAEFRSPFTSGFAPLVVDLWLALAVATAAAFAPNARRWHLGRLCAVAAFGYLSSLAIRNMALFAWVAVPALAANLGEWLARRRAGRPATRAERRRRDGRVTTRPGTAATRPGGETRAGVPRRAGALVAALVLVVLIGAVVTNQLWRLLGIQRELGLGVSRLRFSEEALAFAGRVGIGGRPFNCLALGGFLLWHVGPEERIFVDGRLEAYPEAVFRDYFLVMDAPMAWALLAGEHAFDYAFLYHRWGRLALVRQLIEREGWTLAYYDEAVSLLLPGDEAHRAVRARAAEAFAPLLAARREAPPRGRTALDAVRVPIIEIERLRTYGDFLQSVGHVEEAAEARARARALESG